MIAGYATISGTHTYAEKHSMLQYLELGKSGLWTSQAGFGCYRVSAGIKAHERALHRALTKGVNLIDTSANYADGGSEELVGNVLQQLMVEERIARNQVVVVSKVGYLQGQNYALSEKRKQSGRPFPDLVPYTKGLAHCIHPDFLKDQLTRSLQRLKMGTLDGYLLHNPEYYLGWAHKQGIELKTARKEYYRRIRLAFEHLEAEVAKGRIRFYGISSNTFPATADDPQFTCLTTIWKIAESMNSKHHFQLIQFPMNLLETGAVTDINQPGDRSLLAVARHCGLGVLINRPLNAFDGRRLMRLADIASKQPCDAKELDQRITAVVESETQFTDTILPGLGLPTDLGHRLQKHLLGGQVLQQWQRFATYHRWQEIVAEYVWPHVKRAFQFLEQSASQNTKISAWIASYRQVLTAALEAVTSVYAKAAIQQVDSIKKQVRSAGPDWDQEGSLSQLAVRVLRTTAGITTVLVGMRQDRYVDDILQELSRPAKIRKRWDSWSQLRAIQID